MTETTPKPRRKRTPATTKENPEMTKTLTPSTYDREEEILTADPELVDLRKTLAEIDAHRDAVIAEKTRRIEAIVLFEAGTRVLGYPYGEAPASDDDLGEYEIVEVREHRTGSRAEPRYGPLYQARAVRKDGLLADKAPRAIEVVREAPVR